MFSREETALMISKKLHVFVRATGVLLLALSLVTAPLVAADIDDVHVVGDDVIDTPVEEHGSDMSTM